MVVQVSGNESYAVTATALFETYGDHDAIVFDGGTRYTYAGLLDQMATLATGLIEAGQGPGTTVAVLATNSAESVALALAAHLIGCRTAWIAPTAPESFRREFLRRVGADLFVYEASRFPFMSRKLTDGTGLPIRTLGPGELGPDLLAHPAVSWPAAGLPISTEAPSSLFQTSGTTGEPKLIHHDRLFAALPGLAAAYQASGQPSLRHLLIAGTWHVSSQLAGFLTLLTGGVLHIQAGVDNGSFLRLIQAERITSTLITPPMLYGLLDDPLLAEADLSSVDTFTVSGSAAAPARLAEAVRRLGPVVRITYGLSEAPFISALPNLPDDPRRLSSCGLPYGDTRIAIRDDTGAPLGPNETGQVWVSGSLVMAEYWNQPDLTAESMMDGWLATGDAGYLDDEGYLHLVDRVKDMVVTAASSTNVYCRPVENSLQSYPGIRAAAVIGVPHETYGESVHAFLVAADGTTVDEDGLREFVAGELMPAWAPASMTFVDELPLTGTGKVDKVALRARYRDSVASR